MTVQLTKDQIAAIRVELKKYGLNVLPLPKAQGGAGKKKAKAKATKKRKIHFMWYRPPTMASLTKGHVSTAGRIFPSQICLDKSEIGTARQVELHEKANEILRNDADKLGIHFPHG